MKKTPKNRRRDLIFVQTPKSRQLERKLHNIPYLEEVGSDEKVITTARASHKREEYTYNNPLQQYLNNIIYIYIR